MKQRAEQLIELLHEKTGVQSVRASISNDENDWFRLSAKAYQIHLKNAEKQRDIDERTPHVSAASNSQIKKIIDVNSRLTDYALCLPATSTMSDFNRVEYLLNDMPINEPELVQLVGNAVLDMQIRARQKKGRFEHFPIFREFTQLVEAATICFYRGNFISSYMTLVPVIEGVLLRWTGFNGEGNKPEFGELRKFFSKSHIRQPCPGNPLFHRVYAVACDKILNEHLFKSSQQGPAYNNFNRHLAAHLLNPSQFATRENCIRLFLLIDLMIELYMFEEMDVDPRFNLGTGDISLELDAYQRILYRHAGNSEPEQTLLGIV